MEVDQLWSQVPDWVNYIAQDKSGAWWGFEVEPLQASDFWYENEVGRYLSILKADENLDWRDSLSRRK